MSLSDFRCEYSDEKFSNPLSNIRGVFNLKGSFEWNENYGMFLSFVTLPHYITIVVSDGKWVEIIWVRKFPSIYGQILKFPNERSFFDSKIS